MKDFFKKLQSDVTSIQKSLETQKKDLIKMVNKYADKDQLIQKGLELEQVVEKQLKKYEPSIEKVLARVRDNAKKAGVDFEKYEKKFRTNLKSATSKLKQAAHKNKSTGRKKPSKKSSSTAE